MALTNGDVFMLCKWLPLSLAWWNGKMFLPLNCLYCTSAFLMILLQSLRVPSTFFVYSILHSSDSIVEGSPVKRKTSASEIGNNGKDNSNVSKTSRTVEKRWEKQLKTSKWWTNRVWRERWTANESVRRVLTQNWWFSWEKLFPNNTHRSSKCSTLFY